LYFRIDTEVAPTYGKYQRGEIFYSTYVGATLIDLKKMGVLKDKNLLIEVVGGTRRVPLQPLIFQSAN
jgi:hypothetical protein